MSVRTFGLTAGSGRELSWRGSDEVVPVGGADGRRLLPGLGRRVGGALGAAGRGGRVGRRRGGGRLGLGRRGANRDPPPARQALVDGAAGAEHLVGDLELDGDVDVPHDGALRTGGDAVGAAPVADVLGDHGGHRRRSVHARGGGGVGAGVLAPGRVCIRLREVATPAEEEGERDGGAGDTDAEGEGPGAAAGGGGGVDVQRRGGRGPEGLLRRGAAALLPLGLRRRGGRLRHPRAERRALGLLGGGRRAAGGDGCGGLLLDGLPAVPAEAGAGAALPAAVRACDGGGRGGGGGVGLCGHRHGEYPPFLSSCETVWTKSETDILGYTASQNKRVCQKKPSLSIAKPRFYLGFAITSESHLCGIQRKGAERRIVSQRCLSARSVGEVVPALLAVLEPGAVLARVPALLAEVLADGTRRRRTRRRVRRVGGGHRGRGGGLGDESRGSRRGDRLLLRGLGLPAHRLAARADTLVVDGEVMPAVCAVPALRRVRGLRQRGRRRRDRRRLPAPADDRGGRRTGGRDDRLEARHHAGGRRSRHDRSGALGGRRLGRGLRLGDILLHLGDERHEELGDTRDDPQPEARDDTGDGVDPRVHHDLAVLDESPVDDAHLVVTDPENLDRRLPVEGHLDLAAEEIARGRHVLELELNTQNRGVLDPRDGVEQEPLHDPLDGGVAQGHAEARPYAEVRSTHRDDALVAPLDGESLKGREPTLDVEGHAGVGLEPAGGPRGEGNPFPLGLRRVPDEVAEADHTGTDLGLEGFGVERPLLVSAVGVLGHPPRLDRRGRGPGGGGLLDERGRRVRPDPGEGTAPRGRSGAPGHRGGGAGRRGDGLRGRRVQGGRGGGGRRTLVAPPRIPPGVGALPLSGSDGLGSRSRVLLLLLRDSCDGRSRHSTPRARLLGNLIEVAAHSDLLLQ